jgi:protein SCO1/2
MKRRTYLGVAGAAGIAGVAGCLGDEDGDDSTVLDAPENHPTDPGAVAYPAHGQELPAATVPSPLHDREVTTTEFASGREALLTFVYTRCPDVCSPLTANLARAQARAASEGFVDELALLPITFDPGNDTEPVLRAFSTDRGADPDADNWQFLRPESPERASEVVTGTFGVPFQRETDESEEDAESSDGHNHEDGSHDDHDHVEFSHRSLTLLVNRDGYVERAYTGGPPRADVLLDDLAAVREGYR